MKPRDTALRSKRFAMEEKARKVASIEAMVAEFEYMASDLLRQISAEEERTGIRAPSHFAYSTFAKAARLRRTKLLDSIADLKVKLEATKREHEEAANELSKLEPTGSRDAERNPPKTDGVAMIG
jgi:flagellar FliJ protein